MTSETGYTWASAAESPIVLLSLMKRVRYASARAPTQSDRRAPMCARRRLSGAEHALFHEPMRSMWCTYMGRL